MSKSPARGPSSGPESAAWRFFAMQELLSTPELARFYTDLLINSPSTVTATRERLDLSKSTAYKYANTLEELGVTEELERHEDGSSLWQTDPVSGVWHDGGAVELGPVAIAVYGATTVDDDLELFVDRHGKAAIAPAIVETLAYLAGNTTRRGLADALEIPAVEGIAVSQAIEQIIGVVHDADPTLEDVTFEVDIHERAIQQAPYERVAK